MTEFQNGKYNLEERTAEFGERTIGFCMHLRQDAITKPLISQLVRSATSIGANYAEANGASSKKDFKNKIHICKKESQETKHWLRMLSGCFPEEKGGINTLQKEAQEFCMIFGKIVGTINKASLS